MKHYTETWNYQVINFVQKQLINGQGALTLGQFKVAQSVLWHLACQVQPEGVGLSDVVMYGYPQCSNYSQSQSLIS